MLWRSLAFSIALACLLLLTSIKRSPERSAVRFLGSEPSIDLILLLIKKGFWDESCFEESVLCIIQICLKLMLFSILCFFLISVSQSESFLPCFKFWLVSG